MEEDGLGGSSSDALLILLSFNQTQVNVSHLASSEFQRQRSLMMMGPGYLVRDPGNRRSHS